MMVTKVDYEEYSNPNSMIDRSQLINDRGQKRGDDGFSKSNNEADEFEFDASEIGGAVYDNFEEYTGDNETLSTPQDDEDIETNAAISSLDKLMEGAVVQKR